MSSAEEGSTPKPPKDPSLVRRMFRHPLTHFILALVVISLVQGFVVKLYTVHSTSMEHTLTASERILVNRLAYVFDSPNVGDIVTFTVPSDWDKQPAYTVDKPGEYIVRLFGEVTGIGPSLSVTNVKRIVATPGQVLSANADGILLVNGKPIGTAGTGIDFPAGTAEVNCGGSPGPSHAPCLEFVVPEGEYVVAGDNRPNSSDSLSYCRIEATEDCVRTVPESDIVGKVFVVLFPNTRAV